MPSATCLKHFEPSVYSETQGTATGKPIDVRLKSITFEADRINSYRLEPLPGHTLPAFTAGSHITCRLSNDLARSYSLLNDQEERDAYIIAVQKDPASRGGSLHIHENWRVGDTLTIDPPRNNFPAIEDARHSVLIAGGIGITPILSMAARLHRLTKSWELHYAARSRQEAGFLDRLGRLAEQVPSKVHVHFHHEQNSRRLDIAATVAQSPPDAHLYCCGPASMMQAFAEATLARPDDFVHVEHFTAKQAPAVDAGFEIVLHRSGRRVTVKPGRTILDTLIGEGIDVPFACSQGVCGTCETRVVSGVPDHRDQFLTAEEQDANKTIMICCSGSKSSTLVLDL